jgi:hypothetical protein
MKKLMVLAAAAGVAMTGFTTGVSSASGAPSVVGKKYSEASQALSDAGYTVTVASRVGDQLAPDDCIVAGQKDSNKPFTVGGDKTVLLSVDCNDVLSAATPEGKAAKELKEKQEWQQTPDGQQWCADAKEKNPQWNWAGDPRLAGCRGGG